MPVKDKEVFSINFAFNANKTLVSYVAKYNKAVTLIFSMHREKSIVEDRDDKKPEIIHFCNITKAGVDSSDQKIRSVFRRMPHAKVAYGCLVCCKGHIWS